MTAELGAGEPRFTAIMRMADGKWLISCRECRAVIPGDADSQKDHLAWHARTLFGAL